MRDWDVSHLWIGETIASLQGVGGSLGNVEHLRGTREPSNGENLAESQIIISQLSRLGDVGSSIFGLVQAGESEGDTQPCWSLCLDLHAYMHMRARYNFESCQNSPLPWYVIYHTYLNIPSVLPWPSFVDDPWISLFCISLWAISSTHVNWWSKVYSRIVNNRRSWDYRRKAQVSVGHHWILTGLK